MKRFALKALPYSHDALAPVMSSRTVEAHHDGHQAEHAAKLNQLIDNTSYAHEDLELIIFHTRGDMRCRRIFDNAAQLWNHEFFWESLSPDSGFGAERRQPTTDCGLRISRILPRGNG